MPQNKAFIIGLTGGIACGKSTVSAFLREQGVPVLDADAVSREVTAPGGAALARIRKVFGPKYFDVQNRLDRRRLANLVFSDDKARRGLEEIIHPLVISKMERDTAKFAEEGAHIIVWDVPLLYESGMDKYCDTVWVVRASEQTQLARLEARDGLEREQALARIRSQMPLEEKVARANAVIDNEGDMTSLQLRVKALLKL